MGSDLGNKLEEMPKFVWIWTRSSPSEGGMGEEQFRTEERSRNREMKREKKEK